MQMLVRTSGDDADEDLPDVAGVDADFPDAAGVDEDFRWYGTGPSLWVVRF